MIIPEAQAILVDFFNNNDSFSMKDNYAELLQVSETPEADKAAIQGALDGFVTIGLVVKADDYYVLNRKINYFEQSVLVTAMCAVSIADTLNQYAKISGNETAGANPMKITPENILVLAQLANKGLYYHRQELEETRENDDT